MSGGQHEWHLQPHAIEIRRTSATTPCTSKQRGQGNTEAATPSERLYNSPVPEVSIAEYERKQSAEILPHEENIMKRQQND
jgi:hypothetical protein